jgi:hypothetical protein
VVRPSIRSAPDTSRSQFGSKLETLTSSQVKFRRCHPLRHYSGGGTSFRTYDSSQIGLKIEPNFGCRRRKIQGSWNLANPARPIRLEQDSRVADWAALSDPGWNVSRLQIKELGFREAPRSNQTTSCHEHHGHLEFLLPRAFSSPNAGYCILPLSDL